MEVIINGVRYIPAKDTVANMNTIAKGLLMFCTGVVSDENLEQELQDIHVDINDGGIGVPIQKVLDKIAEISE